MEIIFATGNSHKVIEAKKGLGEKFTLIMPKELGYNGDIPETGNTLEANAIQKCQFLWDKFGKSCFADDTGLIVDALNGEPGVYTARYAGVGATNDENMGKLLTELAKVEELAYNSNNTSFNPDKTSPNISSSSCTNRAARFKTVVALIIDGNLTLFEGVLEGSIAKEKSGTQGFGYDPIFIPQGYDKTLAEISLDEKNEISHRGKAMRKLGEYLNCR